MSGNTFLAAAVGAMLAVPLPSGTIIAAETEPDRVIRDCDACPEMVVVPAGGEDPAGGPVAGAAVEHPFAIGRYEVTFDEWSACVDGGGCSAVPDDHGWGRGRRPVINVNWNDVQRYLEWLGEQASYTYRLPSEAEWDHANRAGASTRFWWGDEAGVGRANCRDCASPWSGHETAPVGSFPPNPFGLFDTSGNVWEWVADCWDPADSGVPSEVVSEPHSPCRLGTIRGGAWYYVSRSMGADHRSSNDRRVGSYTIGFRVARDLQ